MITHSDYADWCLYAGIYLGSVSHADRYRTYAEKLSREGLVTRIVGDFLEQNENGLDLKRWRSYDVYEFGDDLQYRIEQTAQALATIGAMRTAAKVHTAQDESIGGMFLQAAGDPSKLAELMKDIDPQQMMQEFRQNLARAMPDLAAMAGLPVSPIPPSTADPEIESLAEIRNLFDDYVRRHQRQLQADIDRYGDPRTDPDFDPDERLAELDDLYRRQLRREQQQEDVFKLQEYMDQFERRYQKEGKEGKLISQRRKISELYQQYAMLPDEDLTPEMNRQLAKAERFQAKYASFFRPTVTKKPELLSRLDARGPYVVDAGARKMTLRWSAPRGFACDWTAFSLGIESRIGKDEHLDLVLNACDRLQRRWAEHLADLKRQLLLSFENSWEWVQQWAGDDYELDEEGAPTEESILRAAGNGGLFVTIPSWPHDETVLIRGHLPVEWDDEHGFEFELDDEV